MCSCHQYFTISIELGIVYFLLVDFVRVNVCFHVINPFMTVSEFIQINSVRMKTAQDQEFLLVLF